MEITFTQSRSYSLDLDASQERALAKHLGVPLKELRRLVRDKELNDEYGDGVVCFVSGRLDEADITHNEDVEIEEITP